MTVAFTGRPNNVDTTAMAPRYWFTIHWPHPNDPADDHPWFVYLQQAYKAKGQELSLGDEVVFYETVTRNAHRRERSGELVRLKPGRKAVVGIAEVSHPLRVAAIGQRVREYGDGERLNWAWEVPCAGHHWGQAVPYEDVTRVLDRGNVRAKCGLLQIEPSQYKEFRRLLGV
jgi:hypothetical protein